MPRPIHFDLVADDPDRASKFYNSVFGWKFEKWNGPMEYWMITTGSDPEPGIDGGLSKRSPQGGNANTIGVANIDEYQQKITSAGGRVLMPKSPIPGVGWFAQCQDTEGNSFGLMQEDPNAK